jgi:hypothetical protein
MKTDGKGARRPYQRPAIAKGPKLAEVAAGGGSNPT